MSDNFILFWSAHIIPQDDIERDALRENVQKHGVWILRASIQSRFWQICEDYRRQGNREIDAELLENWERCEVIQVCMLQQALRSIGVPESELHFLESLIAEKIITSLNRRTEAERVKILEDWDAWITRMITIMIDNLLNLPTTRTSIKDGIVIQQVKKSFTTV
jgi:hypothetical protein